MSRLRAYALLLTTLSWMLTLGLTCGGGSPTDSSAVYPFKVIPFDLAAGVPFTLDATGTFVVNPGTVRHVWDVQSSGSLSGFPVTTLEDTYDLSLPAGDYLFKHHITISNIAIDGSDKKISAKLGCGTLWTLEPRPTGREVDFAEYYAYSIPDATETEPYSYRFPLSAGTNTLTNVRMGSPEYLPAGLTWDPLTYTVSGIPAQGTAGDEGLVLTVTSKCPTAPPSEAVEFINYRVALKVRPKSLASCPRIVLSAPIVPGMEVGGYVDSVLVTPVGGVLPFALSISAGTLPPGLTQQVSGPGALLLRGIPTAAGTYPVTFQVLDGCAAAPQSATVEVIFVVADAGTCPALAVATDTALPAAQVGQPYSTRLPFYGGAGQSSYELVSGAPPPGLTLSSTGNLTGAALAEGSYTFRARVTDSCAPAQSLEADFTIEVTVGPPPSAGCTILRIGALAVTNPIVNQPFSQQIPITGGVAPLNVLPVGGSGASVYSIRHDTVADKYYLEGTPAAEGTLLVDVRVRDNCSPVQDVSRTYTLTATFTPGECAPALTIAGGGPPSGTLGTAYSYTLPVTGGVGELQYAAVPNPDPLPPGLSLVDGKVLGVPTFGGIYDVTLKVTDSCLGGPQEVTADVTFVIGCPGLFIDTSIAPHSSVVNQGYTPQQLTLTADGKQPVVWFATGLPSGMSITSDGILGGTPTGTGTFPVEFVVRDSCTPQQEDRWSTFLIINDPSCPILNIDTSAAPPDGTLGSSYGPQALQLDGAGSGTKSWTLDTGTLPPGITLSTGGTLSGIPTTEGNFSFSVRVTDSCTIGGPQSDTAPFTINIAPAVSGWAVHEADGANFYAEDHGGAVVLPNGNPAFVFSGAVFPPVPNGPGVGVWVAIANGPNPQIFADWTEHSLSTESPIYMQAAIVDGRLAAVYTLFLDGDPVLALAQVDVPSAVGDYAVSDILSGTPAPGLNLSDGPGLRQVGGTIGLALCSQTTGGVSFYQSSDLAPLGPGDWTMHRCDGGVGSAQHPILIVHDGLPVVGFSNYQADPPQPYLSFADSAMPTSATNWSSYSMDTVGGMQVGLVSTGSGLIMSWGAGEVSDGAGVQKLARATVDPPLGLADWNVHVIDPSRGGSTDVAEFNGRLAVSYGQRYDFTVTESSELLVARALIATPTSASDWQIDVVHDDIRYGAYGRLLPLAGFLGIVYGDFYEAAVQYASHPGPY